MMIVMLNLATKMKSMLYSELFLLQIAVFLFTSLFVFEIVSVVLYFQRVVLDLKDFFLVIFQIDFMLN